MFVDGMKMCMLFGHYPHFKLCNISVFGLFYFLAVSFLEIYTVDAFLMQLCI